jgi:hypothetical protein
MKIHNYFLVILHEVMTIVRGHNVVMVIHINENQYHRREMQKNLYYYDIFVYLIQNIVSDQHSEYKNLSHM